MKNILPVLTYFKLFHFLALTSFSSFTAFQFSVQKLVHFLKITRFLLFLFVVSEQQIFAQSPPNGFTSSIISSEWNEAVGITFGKTGSQMFVWERSGRVWVMENDQKKLLIDISEEVGGWHDLGLLGFALHPQFESNGYFYLLYTVDRHHLLNYGTSSYSATTNEYYEATIGRLTRYTAAKSTNGYSVNKASRKILIGATKSTGVPSLWKSHHVGSLVFGTDGTLLIATGDGSSAASNDAGSAADSYYAQALADGIIKSQETVGAFRSQLLESYNGKILRINPETGNGIASNPWYDADDPGAIGSKVWALGLRNPFRMAIKPGSGSTNPADGKPGTIYVGDVGHFNWEELNVVSKPGMNFGWPLFEGLTAHNGFWNVKTFNYSVPNPLYGVNGCTQQYFYFQDLIKQEMASSTVTFVNPCNTSQQVPATVKTFLHSRPVIDWKHGTGPSRTGIFNGETASVINIGATGSPVSGPQFGGSASVAGVFYPHNDFPAEFRNTYFFGDYAGKWIRNIKVDGNDKPVAVKDFISNGAIVVAMATHPTESGLYYINFPSEIRKITYNNINHPPVAVASSDKLYGTSPLNVQFEGNASSDPDGQPLSYQWNFGDGATSTLANPAHTFTTASSAPIKYTATLTVKDSQNSTNKASLIISVNNTPPQVTITSPVNNSLYPMIGETMYTLRATVSDKEHSSHQLSYQWQTTMHHESHEHPEPIQTSPEATAIISPLGCSAEKYYYHITLTVTDAAGLATKKAVKLFPDCNTSTTPIVWEYWESVPGSKVADIPLNKPPTNTSKINLFEAPANVANYYGARISAYLQVPISGNYTFYIASDDHSELWLSTDATPANRKKIAWVNGWARSREWNKYTSQKSFPIALQAGRIYYIEALHKENAGGDNLAVGWELPDGGLEQPIPGLRLSPYIAGGENKGTIFREYWTGISGNTLLTLKSHAAYPNHPTGSDQLINLESVDWNNPSDNFQWADSYGERIRGYIHPPVSGQYVFWISGDDHCELLISSSDDPAKKVRSAYVYGWTGYRQWNKYSTQKSAPVTMVAGQRYYVEVIHKEAGGGDHVSVGWSKPGEVTASPSGVIPGAALEPYSTENLSTAEVIRSLNLFFISSKPFYEIGPEIEDLQLGVYPNPIEDQAIVILSFNKDQNYRLDLYDLKGSLIEIIHQDNAVANKIYQFELESKTLNEGTYIIRLITKEGVQHLKIILQ